MKVLYAISISRFTLTLLSFTILFVSCSQYDDVLVPGESKTRSYSAETLLKGIFLKEGEVAEKIYPKEDMDTKNKILSDKNRISRWVKINKLIVNEIKNKNPEYLYRLKKEVESKDEVRINKIVSEGMILIKEILRPRGDLDSTNNNYFYSKSGDCVAVVIVALVVVFAFIPLALDQDFHNVMPAKQQRFQQEEVVVKIKNL